MSGKELFEGLSHIDERFVEEAEMETFPAQRTAHVWKLVPMAACLCLLLGLRFLNPEFTGDMPVTVPDEAQTDTLPMEDTTHKETEHKGMPEIAEMDKEALGTPLKDVSSVVLRVVELTDSGFIGTVAEPVDSDIFRLGMELNVVLAENTQNSLLSEQDSEMKCLDTDCTGALITVQFTEFDRESGTLLAARIEETGKDDME